MATKKRARGGASPRPFVPAPYGPKTQSVKKKKGNGGYSTSTNGFRWFLPAGYGGMG